MGGDIKAIGTAGKGGSAILELLVLICRLLIRVRHVPKVLRIKTFEKPLRESSNVAVGTETPKENMASKRWGL